MTTILDDYTAGLPMKAIARRHATTEGRIKYARKKAGVPSRLGSTRDDRERRMMRLWESGAAHSEIARRIGMSVGGVKSMRRRLGLKQRR